MVPRDPPKKVQVEEMSTREDSEIKPAIKTDLYEKEGIDLLRLIDPPIEHLNVDFICGIC